ncbi:MAG: MFS transporter [Peptococcaceae bacterium]|nr:MFS transporter [Peptococcaceae bacterium]
MTKPKLWTKNFILLAVTNFFVALNFYITMVIVSSYAMEQFGASPSAGGLAVSIFVIGGFIARLFVGKWMEQIGRKKMLFIGLSLNLIMSLAYLVSNNLLVLIIVRFLHGVSFGINSTVIGAIVANIIPQERFGEGIAYSMLTVSLATALGPFISMLLYQYGSFTMVFVCCSGVALLGLVCPIFLTTPEIKLTDQQLNSLRGFKISNFLEIKAVRISLVCGLIYLCYSSIISFLTPYAKAIDLSMAASFFFIIYSGIVLISRPFIGKLFDLRGENYVMYPSMVSFIVGMFMLSQAHNAFLLLCSALFIGFGTGAIQSCSMAIALKDAPAHRKGIANATFMMFTDFLSGIGPFVFGIIIPFIGYRGLYSVVAVLAFCFLVLYFFLHGKNAGRSKGIDASLGN